jgi:medium-chain acyl-[acyl-carrier-protein] hydrolase
LLALRLKKKTTPTPAGSNPWFPAIDQKPEPRLRLFCFPYAGGGASVFRTWASRMPAGVQVCPARLPGRESRAAEAPFERIEPLVEDLARAMEPYLGRPSLCSPQHGCNDRFELTRRSPPPAAASGAVRSQRARPAVPPGTRGGAEPSEEEFLAELRRSRACRRCAGERAIAETPPARPPRGLPSGPPVHLSPRAASRRPHPRLRGESDPRLPREVMEPWREQTTNSFQLRILPGGHFFLPTSEEAFSDAQEDAAQAMLRCSSPSPRG